MNKLRCAIYTRKSSEEGLDQSFNSLDAQREACEAYVASQKSEGWSVIRTGYDDGGWSGGSMERPGLKRLLEDIAAGRVDIVVVYKVDRLTRSLADFARIVDVFDRQGASFVSVTQAFNTTSSMGRLTLNVLLSFAQFEREVTGERIRDKIAASKAKGMWMGGYPPLGYDPKDRTLTVNEPEAVTVRQIFARYLELGSVNELARELEANGVKSKQATSSAGITRGGVAFSSGSLFHLLRNRIYLGQIVHKDISHPGLHPAILDAELFAAVQAKLGSRTVQRRERATTRAPLTGLLFDAAGARMTPTHARGRSGQRYLYYVSMPARAADTSTQEIVRRLPANVFEGAVLDRLRCWSARPTAGWPDLLGFLHRIEVHRDAIIAVLRPPPHEDWTHNVAQTERCVEQANDNLQVISPMKTRTRGGAIRRIEAGPAPQKSRPDRALIVGLRRAHSELRARGVDMTDLRARIEVARGMGDPYLRKLSTLAFLAPDIQRAILEGRQPIGLTLATLLSTQLPIEWQEQRRLLRFEGTSRA